MRRNLGVWKGLPGNLKEKRGSDWLWKKRLKTDSFCGDDISWITKLLEILRKLLFLNIKAERSDFESWGQRWNFGKFPLYDTSAKNPNHSLDHNKNGGSTTPHPLKQAIRWARYMKMYYFQYYTGRKKNVIPGLDLVKNNVPGRVLKRTRYPPEDHNSDKCYSQAAVSRSPLSTCRSKVNLIFHFHNNKTGAQLMSNSSSWYAATLRTKNRAFERDDPFWTRNFQIHLLVFNYGRADGIPCSHQSVIALIMVNLLQVPQRQKECENIQQ